MSKKQLLIIALFFGFITFFNISNAYAQGTTTAAINGVVTDDKGETLPGATVVATHLPTGSQYGTVTRLDGRYNFPNARVGGPYKIVFSFVGFEDQTKDNVYLKLGQDLRLDATLQTKAIELEGVQITANSGSVIGSGRTGAETNISEKDITSLPTISRGLNDFTRLTPQATITTDGGLSIAGMNNRYNSIFIDGAVNNDVFGLASSGTNGGQTGISPISIDAIEQFQVVLAPYDVRLGNFAGGGINAVTRSGSNEFQGSAYWLFRNENLTGKTPTYNLPDGTERTKVASFSAKTFGVRVGGPLVKDKAFFFVNAELQRDETPRPFDFSTYTGASSEADLALLISKLNELGYDPGTYLNISNTLNSDKFLARFDVNLTDKHKLTMRHSYTKGESTSPAASGNRTINFANAGILFPSTTNSSAVELKSMFSNQLSNDLILGFTAVKDDRNPIGNAFPFVNITDGAGAIRFGSEEFSTANLLEQKIFTLTDNVNIYKGKNTFTFGTHNEFYKMRNVFVRQNFGSYRFNSLQEFLNDSLAAQYDRSYSLVDDVTGDGTAAAPDFTAMQLGFYAQNETYFNANFKVTAGLRLDVPLFTSQPKEDTYFNETTIGLIEAAYDGVIDDPLKGAKAGKMPKAQLLLSPRVGFNWDVTGKQKTQLRGGVGIFTSRVPFVWPGGSYTNNGLSVGGVRKFNVPFIADPFNQPTTVDFGGTDKIPSGEMNLFSEKFKYPQVFRTSLALDQELPGGLTATLEGMYTKTLNNVFYYNLNVKPSVANLTGTPDNRPLYKFTTPVDATYTGIYLADNTNEGYTYNLTAQLQKAFERGFSASLAYTFGRATSVYEGTSSQNSSQWRGQHSVKGRNFATPARSDFDLGHRIVGFGAYRIEYGNNFGGATTISLFYNGQSGTPYSYIYNDDGKVNNEDSRERNLIYIPKSQSEIILVQDGTRTPEQQWEELNAYIEADDYLSQNRGQYAERNMSRTPFTNIFDLRVLQDVAIKAGGKRHALQVSFDIFNLNNLINKDWGRIYNSPGAGGSNFNSYELLTFKGFVDPNGTTTPDTEDDRTPTFTFPAQSSDPWTLNDLSSRWRMQIGLRYLFN